MKHVFHVWHTPQPLSLGHARKIVREQADEVVGEQPLLDAYARWLAQMFPARGKEDDVLPEGAPPAPCTKRVINFRVELDAEQWGKPKNAKDNQLYRMLVMKALESSLHVLAQAYSPVEQIVEGVSQVRGEPEDSGALYMLPGMRCPPAWIWDYVPDEKRTWPLPDAEEVQRVILTRLAAALAPHGFRVAPGMSFGPILWRVRGGQAQAITVPCRTVDGYHGVEVTLEFALGETAASVPVEKSVLLAPRIHNKQLLGFDTGVCIRNALDVKVAGAWLEQLALRDVLAALDAVPRGL